MQPLEQELWICYFISYCPLPSSDKIRDKITAELLLLSSSRGVHLICVPTWLCTELCCQSEEGKCKADWWDMTMQQFGPFEGKD